MTPTWLGYCKDCAEYGFIEDLRPREDSEIDLGEEFREWEVHLRAYLAQRTGAPHCVRCGGVGVVALEWSEDDVINPITGTKYRVSTDGIGYVPGLPLIVLSEDGRRMDITDEKAEELSERVYGRYIG